MSTQIILVLIFVVFLAMVFARKAPAIGLFDAVTFFIGFGIGLLVPFSMIQDAIGKTKGSSGAIWSAIKSKLDLGELMGAFRGEEMSKSSLFKVTAFGGGLILFFRFLTSVAIPFLIGVVCGFLARAWAAYFGFKLV